MALQPRFATDFESRRNTPTGMLTGTPAAGFVKPAIQPIQPMQPMQPVQPTVEQPRMTTMPVSEKFTQPVTPVTSRTTDTLFGDYTKPAPVSPTLAPATTQPNALGSYTDFLGQQELQGRALGLGAIESGDFSNLAGADINKLRQDPRNVTEVFDKAIDENVLSYIAENEIPPFKEINGQKVYLNTGRDTAQTALGGGLATEEGAKAGKYVGLGPVGEYNVIWQEEPTGTEAVLNDPLINVAASFIPGGTLALTAAKGATGQTLDTGDWLTLGMGGLEMAGVITPPSTPAGGIGPVDQGVGLFGTTYNQTKDILEGATALGEGNAAGALIKGFDLATPALEKIGLGPDIFDNSVVDYDAFKEGIEESAAALANGESLDDALKVGVIDYVREDDNIDIGGVKEIVKEIGREIDDNFFQPILNSLPEFDNTLLDGLKQFGREFDDEVLQEIKAGVEDFAPEIEDFVRTVGSGTEDVVRAVGRGTEDIVKAVGGDVIDVVGDLGSGIEDAIRATGSELEDFIRPIGSTVEDIAKATGRTVGDVLEGVADLTGDLGSNLEDAIREGGSALEDFIRPIGSTIEDIARVTGSTTEDVLKGVAATGGEIIGEIGEVGEDILDALGPLGSTLEDFARATGSTLEDVLRDVGGLGEDILGGVAELGSDLAGAIRESGSGLEDFVRSTGSSLEDVVRASGSTLEDLVRESGSTLEDVVRASGSTLEDIVRVSGSGLEDVVRATGSTMEDLLRVTGSSIEDGIRVLGSGFEDLLKAGFGGLSAQQAQEAQAARNLQLASRTTDSLFSEFKGFKTEIGGTPQELVQLIQRPRRNAV